MAYKLEPVDSKSDTVLYMSAGININTPASHVFDILIHTKSWPEWNSFCPAVTITSKPPESGISDDMLQMNAKMAVQVRMTPTSSLRTSNMSVTRLDTPPTANGEQSTYTVCWKAVDMPEFLLRANRTLQCRSEPGSSTCEFRTFEIMAGAIAHVVKAMYGKTLQDRFEDMARDLKEYAERTWISKEPQ